MIYFPCYAVNVKLPGVVGLGVVYVNTVYPGADPGVVTVAPGALPGYFGVGIAIIIVPDPPIPLLDGYPPPLPPPVPAVPGAPVVGGAPGVLAPPPPPPAPPR
jgi:hypothetical protein